MPFHQGALRRKKYPSCALQQYLIVHCMLIDTSQHGKLLANEADNCGTVVVKVRDDLEGPAGLVPRGLVRLLLLGAGSAATQADRDAKDTDAAAGARCLLELGVKSLGSGGTDADLVAKAADDNDLADPGKSLDILGGICAELVLGNIDVPVIEESEMSQKSSK